MHYFSFFKFNSSECGCFLVQVGTLEVSSGEHIQKGRADEAKHTG